MNNLRGLIYARSCGELLESLDKRKPPKWRLDNCIIAQAVGFVHWASYLLGHCPALCSRDPQILQILFGIFSPVVEIISLLR